MADEIKNVSIVEAFGKLQEMSTVFYSWLEEQHKNCIMDIDSDSGYYDDKINALYMLLIQAKQIVMTTEQGVKLAILFEKELKK